ncbi:hypothetical protein MKX08_005594 [Trichoderma sp. CBMAI-0020]|nr:hypothetical protein MKX08_005594 [Trichoderma sp. CBMAI-0020]
MAGSQLSTEAECPLDFTFEDFTFEDFMYDDILWEDETQYGKETEESLPGSNLLEPAYTPNLPAFEFRLQEETPSLSTTPREISDSNSAQPFPPNQSAAELYTANYSDIGLRHYLVINRPLDYVMLIILIPIAPCRTLLLKKTKTKPKCLLNLLLEDESRPYGFRVRSLLDVALDNDGYGVAVEEYNPESTPFAYDRDSAPEILHNRVDLESRTEFKIRIAADTRRTHTLFAHRTWQRCSGQH